MTPRRRTDDEIVAMARDLPFAPPRTGQIEQMRAVVLATLQAPRPRRQTRWWLLAAIAAVSVAVTLVLWGTRHPEAVSRRGHVLGVGLATYAELGGVPDEIVQLVDGRIHVEVDPLAPGERFRVVIGDSEVEVRGTAFDVIADHDHLIAVTVDHGRVEVRSGTDVRQLGRGESWSVAMRAPAKPVEAAAVVPTVPPQPAPLAPSAPPKRVQAMPARESAPHVKAADPSAVERAFREGWDALRANDPETAATSFDRSLALDARGQLAEDSAYWRAVAYRRAGRAETAHAFRQFLAKYPASVRAGEAAAQLGQVLLEAGDLDGATTQFETAARDDAARIRAMARDGLAEIRKRSK